jgi:hypothetical protein
MSFSVSGVVLRWPAAKKSFYAADNTADPQIGEAGDPVPLRARSIT